MDLQLNVRLTETKTTIQFNETQDVIEFITTTEKQLPTSRPTLFFLVDNMQPLAIGTDLTAAVYQPLVSNKVIAITPAWDVELNYLEQLFLADYAENDIQLVTATEKSQQIPKNQVPTLTKYKEQLEQVLVAFGYSLYKKSEPVKKKPAKARHKWTKEVSQIEFHIDTRQSKATALWQKRNEMLIKAGATMMPEAPLNKDGSLGFSAKMGEKLRDEHKTQFKDFVTTEDIVLKSVNEVGLFLYFGGTNSWLELVDENQKTINEWTVVE